MTIHTTIVGTFRPHAEYLPYLHCLCSGAYGLWVCLARACHRDLDGSKQKPLCQRSLLVELLRRSSYNPNTEAVLVPDSPLPPLRVQLIWIAMSELHIIQLILVMRVRVHRLEAEPRQCNV